MSNARLSERAPFVAEVDVLASGAPAPRRVWGSDVSETGIFLQTTHPFRVGDRVSLRFDVEQSEVHVRAAEVMWVRPFEPISVDGKVPGIGLKFVAVDPPARAALRRFVQPQLGQNDVTLPEQAASDLAPLPPAAASLPPITTSILARARGLPEATDEMFAVSLPPFSQPPLSLTIPPDGPSGLPSEVRVFSNTKPMGTPRPVTILPAKNEMKKASMPPNALLGWQFRLDGGSAAEEAQATDPPSPTMGQAEHHSPTPMPSLHMRFDDDAPGMRGTLSPVERSEPVFDVTSTPPEAVLRDAFSHNAVGGDLRGDLRSEPSGPVESGRAFEEGMLAVRHLPIAEERRSANAPRHRSRTLPIAMALLCSGSLVGVGIGTLGKQLRRNPVEPELAVAAAARAMAPVGNATPARSVDDVERELVPPRATAPVAVVAPAVATLEAKPEPKPAVKAEAKVEVLTSRATVAPTAAALAAPAAPAAPVAPAVAAPRNIGESLKLKVGGGRILKTFVLDSPSRVVVDLAGATLPQAPLGAAGRIARVRFGTPAPGTGRVVIELDGSARARDVKASIDGGTLQISFR